LPGSLDLGEWDPLGVDSKRAAGGAGHELMVGVEHDVARRDTAGSGPDNLKARAAQHGCEQRDGWAGALAYPDQASPGSGMPEVNAGDGRQQRFGWAAPEVQSGRRTGTASPGEAASFL